MLIDLFRLNNGREVLDRTDHDGNAQRNPYKYMIRAHAQRKANALCARGYAAIVYQSIGSRVFYIAFDG